MTSSFGWLDNDDEQRRRMIEVVDLFREKGTIDELGIGSIRDTVADSFFPGTSTLHTRLRYTLFLPWLLQLAAKQGSAREMVSEFRALEHRLIDSLMAGGEVQGVMGNVARTELKRLPSVAYWSALRQWGLADARSSEAFFRRTVDLGALSHRATASDDPEAREVSLGSGLDAHLPKAPSNLLKSTSFALTSDEEDYLSHRISTSTRGSLFAWFIANKPNNVGPGAGDARANFPWEASNIADLDSASARLVEHARRFSSLMHGAALTYNLGLAVKARRDDEASAHEAALAAWWESDDAEHTARTWDRADWWNEISLRNNRLSPRAAAFVDDWVELVSQGFDAVSSERTTLLIANRERQIKGGRARFYNQAALDRWSGASGLGRLDFRWGITTVHLSDLYTAREAA